MRVRSLAAVLLFCAGLAYFVARGPYRALGPLNSYDFAAVYGAARCWQNGHNPYDMAQVRKTVLEAGDRPPLPYSDPPPSVYLPTALPLVAPLALLPWIPARLIWCLLSTSAFVCSLMLVLRSFSLPGAAKWLAGAAMLFFSPTSSGLSTGNPSVLSCGLVLLAVYSTLAKRPLVSALALGAAHCLKPQISICAVVLFALWGYWKPLLLSLLVPVVSGAASVLQAGSIGEYRRWLADLQQGVAASLAPGAINDPRPSNIFSYHMLNAQALFALFVSDLKVDDLIVWALAAAMAAVYLRLRRGMGGDPRWRDMAFFSAVTLTVVYHRYYDAQLLLLAVPFVICSLREDRGRGGRCAGMAVLGCLLVLVFPLQAMMAGWSAALPANRSLIGFLLLRHQPLTVVVLCFLLAPWPGTPCHQVGDDGPH